MSDWLQGKSPKMWVNELCVKQLVRPQWETREAFPGQQPPTFICTCTIAYTDRKLQAEGRGKTKKDAEQEAASEMLVNKLGMTPAKLMTVTSNAKKKAAASPPRPNGSTAGSSGDGDGDVSDTDDKELAAAVENPITELNLICDQQELPDPEYAEENEEGPPHKRIFTIRCTVVDNADLKVSDKGRRYTKKVAKRVAAFRVLRELKRLGYKHVPYSEEATSDADDSVVDASRKATIEIATVANGIAAMENRNGDHKAESCALSKAMQGERTYCKDTSGKCVELLANFSHVYQHLRESDALKLLLEKPELDACREFGGAIKLLRQIFKETGISYRFYSFKQDDEDFDVVFVEMGIPFPVCPEHDSEQIRKERVACHGKGDNLVAATSAACKEALMLLKENLI